MAPSLLQQPLFAVGRRGVAQRPPLADGRRFLIVHLDGVSRPVLLHALQEGRMPALFRELREGRLRLSASHAGAPASTPAYQTALLYGRCADVPGFVWHDKRRGVDVRMDSPQEALRLEKAQTSPGLLRGGSVYFSIVSGGAAEPAFTTSRLARPFAIGGSDPKNVFDHLATAFAHGLPLIRGAGRFLGGSAGSILSSLRWSMRLRRLTHEPRFFLHRALLAELLTELATWFTLLDLSRGVPAIYTVFAGYDEIAHRRGPWSDEAMRELSAADAALGDFLEAMRRRPELGYELFVLSDHGQVDTRPIEQLLSGPNLADWILAAGPTGCASAENLRSLARERRRRERLAALPFIGRHCGDGAIREGGGDEGRPPLVVADAGDVAHVYLADRREPHDLESLRARWPGPLRAVLRCPGGGIVAMRGGRGGFAFHRGRRIDLSEPGSMEDVLGYDGERLRRYLLQMLAMPSAGDLVVYGAGVEGGDVAFSWEFGSHGGVGGEEVDTFLIHPPDAAPDTDLPGPADLHRWLSDRYLCPDG